MRQSAWPQNYSSDDKISYLRIKHMILYIPSRIITTFGIHKPIIPECKIQWLCSY